jgi:hypothetical protein
VEASVGTGEMMLLARVKFEMILGRQMGPGRRRMLRKKGQKEMSH